MKKIFVIGNIGSGKSTFCEYLGEALGSTASGSAELESAASNDEMLESAASGSEAHGAAPCAVVINLDKLGHDALHNADVQAAIKAAFGPIRTRVELAHVAFSDASNLNRLNQITHPHILQDLRLRLQEASQAGLQFAIVEQTAVDKEDDSFLKLADAIVCISSSKIYSETPNRVNAQLSQKQLQGFADIVVENNAGLVELKEKARQVALKIKVTAVQVDTQQAATKIEYAAKQNLEEN